MKTFREYLAEAKINEKDVDLNENIKFIKASAATQWDEFRLGKLIIKIPEDSEFDITLSIDKSELEISFDDMEDLCKRILKLM